MRSSLIILILATVGLFSCKQSNKSSSDTAESKTSDSAKNIQNKKIEKYIYNTYKYADSTGKNIIIQNSLPRGGTKYTYQNGEDYNYALFWTQIINETDNPLELKMEFPVDSYEVPSLPGRYYKVLIPADTMTLEKSPMFNYGLKNIESFLDNNIHKSASLKRTINPKESSGFYVVILCLIEGAHGTMRTGLTLTRENLFYRINIDGSKSNTKSSDKEINCGSINLKDLILQK
jgi:hypothetical protein